MPVLNVGENLPFKFRYTSTYDMTDKNGVRCKRLVRRTDGGTSAIVAIKSQMRPLKTEIHISECCSKREPPLSHLLPEDPS